MSCHFCEKHISIEENELFYSKWDLHPVSQGHALVIPKRHIESFFELSIEELIQLYALVKNVKNKIQSKYHPDGYNIGINEGEVAGRTIHHLHIHIIPRYIGDIESPRGGIRNIIPGKGNY